MNDAESLLRQLESTTTLCAACERSTVQPGAVDPVCPECRALFARDTELAAAVVVPPWVATLKDASREQMARAEAHRQAVLAREAAALKSSLEAAVAEALGPDLLRHASPCSVAPGAEAIHVDLLVPGHRRLAVRFERSGSQWARAPFGPCTHGTGWATGRGGEPFGFWLVDSLRASDIALVADLGEALLLAEVRADDDEIPF